MKNNQITVNPSAIVRTLAVMCAVLVAASVAGQLVKYLAGRPYMYGLVPMFYVDAEHNLPTMFSVVLLLIAALLLALVATLKAHERNPYAGRWKLLAWGFAFMALDEGASIHELFTLPGRQLLGGHGLGILHFSWVIPFGLLVLILAFYFMKFVASLPRRTAFSFVLAAIIYVGGAIGFEMLGGRYAELHGNENPTYVLLATVEETLEMAGVIVFIHALLQYVAQHYSHVHIRCGDLDVNLQSRQGTP
jgi:hypothetical protein